jgi:hypothetical protein
LVIAAGLADSRQTLEEIAEFSRAKWIHKSPRENLIVVRNTLVYWGEYRESDRKVGTQKLDIFSTLLYEGNGLSLENDVKPYKQFSGPVSE